MTANANAATSAAPMPPFYCEPALGGGFPVMDVFAWLTELDPWACYH